MNNGMAYVAICKCGGLVMATMDTPGRKREVAGDVARHIKLGNEIRRITADEVRAIPWCKNRGDCEGPAEAPDPRQMDLGL